MLRRALALTLALLPAAVACSNDDGARLQSEDRSSPMDPPLECAPGSSPRLGEAACVPVGPAMKDTPGFVRDKTGWGYAAVLPATGCEGATRAAIGEPECRPIDDCAAAFPPPGADVVLTRDPTMPTQLADALTRLRPGGTIAIDEGVWDAISLAKDARIVGRCASKVVIRSTGPRPTWNETPGAKETGRGTKGIDLPSNVTLEVRSVTIEGFDIGVYADHGEVLLDRVVLSGNRAGVFAAFGAKLTVQSSVVTDANDWPRVDANGIAVAMGTTTVAISDVEIRGMDTGVSVASPSVTLTMKRAVVHRQHVPLYRGSAFEAFRGATARIEESVLDATEGVALVGGRVLGTPPKSEESAGPAKVTIARSVLSQSGLPTSDPKDKKHVMTMWDGLSVDLEDATVHHGCYGAIAVTSGSKLTAKRAAFTADPARAPVRLAIAVYDRQSKLVLEDSAIVGAQQVGLLVHDGGAAQLSRSIVTGTKHMTAGDLSDLTGTGQAVSVGHDGLLEVEGSAFVGNEGIAIFGLDRATFSMSRALVDDTRASSGALGVGIFLSAGTMSLSSSLVRRSADAALAFDASSALVTQSFLTDAPVAVRAAGGTEIVQAEEEPIDIQELRAVLYKTRLERVGAASSADPPALP